MWTSFLAGIRSDTQGHPQCTEPFPKSSQRPRWGTGGIWHQHSSLFTPVHSQVVKPPWSLSREGRTAEHQQMPLASARAGLRAGLAHRVCDIWTDRMTLSMTALTALSTTSAAPRASLVIHSARSYFHSCPSSPHRSQAWLFSDRYCDCHFLNSTI